MRPAAFIVIASLLLTLCWGQHSHARQSASAIQQDDQYQSQLTGIEHIEELERHIAEHPPANDVQQAAAEIARRRASLVDGELLPAERFQAVEEMIAIRRKLLERHPKDQRRAVWLCDLATDLYFELLQIDGAGLTTLFGLPTPEQRARAHAIARELVELAERADAELSQALLALESTPGFADDVALQQRRRELTDRERQRRIPFFHGIGAFLHAEFSVQDHAEQRKLYQSAVNSLSPLIELLEGSPALLARLYSGLAQARLGDFDAAEDKFAAVARHGQISPAEVFAARMGGIINRTVRGGNAAGLEALESIEPKYSGPEHIFYRVLIFDHRFLLRMLAADRAAAADRPVQVAAAIATYTQMMQIDLGVPMDTMRSIAFARLALAAEYIGDGVPLNDLPPIVSIARAHQLAQHEQSRSQAITMLETALSEPTLQPWERAAALFVLGRALVDEGHALFAAQRFIDLAEHHPSDPQAEVAIELGVSIAADLHRRSESDTEARQILQRGITILLDRYPNLKSIDRWRYTAGRLALSEDRFDQAAARFAEVTPNAREWLDAHYMLALTARTRAASGLENASLHDQTLAVIERVEPIIRSGIESASDSQRLAALRYYLASLAVLRAESLMDLSRPQDAIEALRDIEATPNLEPQVLGQALKVRISAHQSLGQPEAALEEVRDLLARAPAQAPVVLGPMLQSLQREVDALLDASRDDQAIELAQRRVLPIAQLYEQWLIEHDQSPDEQHDLLIANAYRHSGQCERALQWYERLLRDHPDALELLLGRAECLMKLGGEQRLAVAMTLYKRIAASVSPSAPASSTDSQSYWLAHLRMLQILDKVNRNTEKILPQIERLRLEDANYGGERFRRGFDALRMKYGGR